MGLGRWLGSDSESLDSEYTKWRTEDSGPAVLVPRRLATVLAEEAHRADALDCNGEAPADDREPGSVLAPRPKTARPPDAQHVDIGLLGKAVEAVEPPSPLEHRVWNPRAVLERIERHNSHSTGDREARERDAAVLRRMVERGPDLPMQRVDELALAGLYEHYGHMHRALDAIRADLLVTGICRPLLIAGPPGVGKTHFVRAMAEALGLEHEMFDASTGVNATTLVGLQRTWANTEIGAVFRHLTQSGRTANPVFVIDEIDQAPSTGRYRLTSALRALLEPVSARCVRDLSADLEIDASGISWIALTNSLDKLSRPLLSRFQLVTPSEPTPAQRLHVAKQIAVEVAADADLRRIDRDIVVALADRTSREIQQALKAAANRAVAAGRSAVMPTDVLELGMVDRQWH